MNVLLVSHNSGTGFWRCRVPMTMLQDAALIDLTWISPQRIPFRDRFWVQQFDAVVLHQEWSDEAFQLASMAKMYGKRLILSVDDLVAGWKIPRYIAGGIVYKDARRIDTIKQMMEMADRIVVTQPTLKKELARHFEIDERKFVLFPNMPSCNWAGGYMNPVMKTRMFQQRRGQLRVGVMSSLSHYETMDITNQTEDDFQIVVDAAKQLKGRVKLKWVLPLNNDSNPMAKRILDAAGSEQVEIVNQVPITLFPRHYQSLGLDVVAVPLLKNTFNDCKSNIKLLEAAAMGVLPIVSESDAYDPFIDRKWQFKDADGLADRIIQARALTSDVYGKLIEDNYRKFYGGQTDYYGIKLNGYFLDNNLMMAMDAFFGQDKPLAEDQIVPPKVRGGQKN